MTASHTVFDSLLKVLFTFRSRYLFAIGLERILSLWWDIPPVKTALPSSPTLEQGQHGCRRGKVTGLLPSVAAPFQETSLPR